MSSHKDPAKSFEDSLSSNFLPLNSQSDDDDISQEQDFIYDDSFNTRAEIDSATVLAIRTKQFNHCENNKDLTRKTPSDIKWAKKENPRQHKMNYSERQQILKDLQELKSQIYQAAEDENNNRIVELKNIKEQVITANKTSKYEDGHKANGDDDAVKLDIPTIEIKEQTTVKINEKETKDNQENESKKTNNTTKTKKGTTKSTHLHFDDHTNENGRSQRKRYACLKTGKPSYGTPHRNVKILFFEKRTIPKLDKFLMPLFKQPGDLPNFLDIVREKLLCLLNIDVINHINQTITGNVRVRNLDFYKSVHIRYSSHCWRSFTDLQANYVENSCDGFSFILFSNSLHIDHRLVFAIRFQCNVQHYWDNNYGANY